MSIQQHLLTVHGRSSSFFQKNLKNVRRYIILSPGTLCSYNASDGNLDWHTAFRSAAEIELHADLDKLHFRGEYLLGKQPMRSDLLITCPHKNVQFHSNLAQIFRTYNFVEYKSPDDLMTVKSFYKVYAYACKFLADMPPGQKPKPDEVTLTFICSHYPVKMLRHLQKHRKIQVHKREAGIYDLTGDPFAMQLIVLPRLTKEKNFWLYNLRNNIKDTRDIEEIADNYNPHKNDILYQSVMDVITRANYQKFQEVRIMMCEALEMLFADELAEGRVKALAEGRSEGRAIGLAEGRATGLAEGRATGLAEGRATGLTEGRATGLTEGRLEGIKAFIAGFRDLQMTPSQICEKLMKYFSLNQSEAEEYLRKY